MKSYFEGTNKSVAAYIRPVERTPREADVGGFAMEEERSLHSSITALKGTVDTSKKIRTLVKGGKTSYVLYKAGKNNDLRAELEKGPNGKKYYRIVATKKGFEILGIEPDAEAARELNRGLPKGGKKWNETHILKAETNTAILKYYTKKPKAAGWSKAGKAAIEKYPEIQYLTHKDASRIEKAKIVGKAEQRENMEYLLKSYLPVIIAGSIGVLFIVQFLIRNINVDLLTQGFEPLLVIILGPILFFTMMFVLPEQLILLYCKYRFEGFNFYMSGHLKELEK